MQVGFIDVICLPLYRVLTDTFPWIRPLLDGTIDNRQHWQDLAEKVEMGLTWIDHDTIDKPVEEFSGKFLKLMLMCKVVAKILFKIFSACPAEVKDIEFTVTTLNCTHHEPEVSPHRRRKFNSLRKTGALSKAVRSRLSKSFYSSSNPDNRKADGSTTSQAIRSASAEKPSEKSENDQKAAVAIKSEKLKKRSKLCLLL